MVAKLERVGLRDVWKHEALDFTTWLEGNIEVLSELLDFSLVSAEREKSAGSFSVDLVAEDEAGNPVIIENQLEKSDHDHLGKLITYLTAIGAKRAIWIVSHPRPEHISAVSWLNESASADFYLVKLEAVRIEGSAPAPLLTLIVGPSEDSRAIREEKNKRTERHEVCRRFWTALLERAKKKTQLHSAISPGWQYWIGTGAGKSLSLNYVARKRGACVELYIDRGKDEADNVAVFDELAASKDAIRDAFGEPLQWEKLEGRRACRIKKEIDLGGYADEEETPEIHNAMIEAMIRLEKALRPHIDKLRA